MGSVTRVGEEAIMVIVADFTAVVGMEDSVVVVDFPEMGKSGRMGLRRAKIDHVGASEEVLVDQTAVAKVVSEEVLVDQAEAVKAVSEVDVVDFPDPKELNRPAMLRLMVMVITEEDLVVDTVVEVVLEVETVVLIEGVAVEAMAIEVLPALVFKRTPRVRV